MVLHSKLMVTKKGETRVLFNTILTPIVNAIKELGAYSRYLAYGTGKSETVGTETTLENITGVFELVTESFNFNPANGELFIKKKLVFDETDQNAYEFSEFGLTAWPEEENPRVVNRYLLNSGEPIFRDPGEEMSFELIVFLIVPALGGSVCLTSGSNKLVASLLGDEVEGGGINGFRCARSNNSASNNEYVEIEYLGEGFPASCVAEVNEDGKSVSLKITSSLGVGLINELLVLYAGKVVMRSNVMESFGLKENEMADFVADFDNTITVNISAVAEITSVVDVSTGEEITDYTIKKYGTGFLKVIDDPFGGVSYSKDYGFGASKCGNHFVFYDVSANTCRGFMIDGESLMEVDSSKVDLSNTIMVRVGLDQIICKVYDPTTDKYSVRNFWKDSYTTYYEKKSYYLDPSGFDGVSHDDKWNDFDLVQTSRTDGDLLVMVYGDLFVYYFNSYLSNGTIFFRNGRNISTQSNTLGKVLIGDRTGRADALSCVYSTKFDRVEFLEHKGTLDTSTNILALAIMKDEVEGNFPRIGKNNLFSYNNTTRQLNTFNLISKVGRFFPMPEVKRLYVSDNFDYMAAQKDDDTFVFYFVDGDLNFIEFTSGLPDGINGSDVEDLRFLKGAVLLFMADGTNKILVINENKYLLVGISEDTSATITYSVNNMPGASGSAVRAELDTLVSVVE